MQDRDGVVLAFDEQIDGLRAELRGVEAVEQDRPAAALGVADFTGEDRFARRVAAAVELEILVADELDELARAAPRPRR